MAHGHSWKTNDPEFARMHPRIIEMCVVLQLRKKPNQVYEKNVLEGNSFDLPRDIKQMRNLGEAIRSNKPGKALHNARPIKNIARHALDH